MSTETVRNTTAPGPRTLERLTTRQVETLQEIASGYITVSTYPTGYSYMGPQLVFDPDDLATLAKLGLISVGETVALTPAGVEALVTAPDSAFPSSTSRLEWVRRLKGTR